MCGKVNARKLRGGNEDDQCNFSSLVSFDWRSTIDTFDIKCTGDFSKILTYVCDIIGAPKEMYCAINLAVEWRTSI